MIKVIVKYAGEAREFTLTDTVLFIGRSGECQIKLTDLKSSRKHARIEKVGDAYRVFDLESGNGTRVNGSVVNDFALAKGDEIVVGESSVMIADLDTPPPLRATPKVEEIVEKDPVPIDRKMDVKQRIDEVKKQIDEVKAREGEPTKAKILKKLAGFAAACLALVAGAVVVTALMRALNTTGPVIAKKPVTDATGPTLQEADKALAAFRSKLDSSERVTDELIAECRELGSKYADTYRNAHGDSAAVPFDQILQTMMTRRAEVFGATFAHIENQVRDDVKARRYASAVSRLEAFKKSADNSFEERVRELVAQIDSEIEQDYAAVKAKGDAFDAEKRYEEEANHYRIHATRFEGTKYFSTLPKPDQLLELARIASAKRDTTAKVDKQPEKAPEVVVKTPEATGLAALLIKPISEGKLLGRTFPLAEDKKGTPLAADAEKVTAKVGEKQEQIAWKDVAPAAMFAMASILLREDDLLGVASYGYANNLKTEADKLLVRYVDNKKERQEKADAVIAKGRGLGSVPAGGFTWEAKHGWEDKPTRDTRLAREEGDKLAKELATARDPKKMDHAFTRLVEMINNQAIVADLRTELKTATLASLKANKQARLDDIGKKAKASVGMAQVRAAKLELNKRREEALKVIYDPKIYLPEDHPDWRKGDKINGQERVDQLVKAVRQLWDSAGSYIAQLDGSIKKDIDQVVSINGKYLEALGETPSEDDLKDFEEVMNNLDRRIDLKSFALNARESEIYEWNRKVERYNDALKDADVPGNVKVHVKVVNDYREMMGRKQCFIDARLCRATKKHSGACDAAGRIWHVGSDGDPQSRAKAEGFQGGVGENVAIGYGDGAPIWVEGWYRASDHHRNGLSDAWNCVGYGFQGRVGTQNFANIAAPKGF